MLYVIMNEYLLYLCFCFLYLPGILKGFPFHLCFQMKWLFVPGPSFFELSSSLKMEGNTAKTRKKSRVSLSSANPINHAGICIIRNLLSSLDRLWLLPIRSGPVRDSDGTSQPWLGATPYFLLGFLNLCRISNPNQTPKSSSSSKL